MIFLDGFGPSARRYEQIVTVGGRQMVLDWRGRAKNWSFMFSVPLMYFATAGV